MTGWFGSPDNASATNAITVIGYDGSPLSPEALTALHEADLVVGGRRHLDSVPLLGTARTLVMGPLDAALTEIRTAVEAGDRVAIVASGDPGLFGITRALTSSRSRLNVRVLPAVSSIAAAFGRLGLPWDDAVVISAHGRPLGPALNVWRRYAAEERRVALLTDEDSGPLALLDGLGDDFGGCEVLERLGESDERRTTVLAAEPAAEIIDPDVIGPAAARVRKWSQPLLMVSFGRLVSPTRTWFLGQRAAFGNEPVGWALPDDAFAHRDGMLTKRDVRAVVLPRLAPTPGTMVWDLGAGSGSVGVECSRLGAAVIAVEQGDVQDIVANTLALHGPVKVVQGKAPDVLAGLPFPDAVFVGGGGPEVVAAVAGVRPKRVVVALATVERVAPTVAALEGYDVETILVQISHLQPLGAGHRLVPANPVFVVSGVLP